MIRERACQRKEGHEVKIDCGWQKGRYFSGLSGDRGDQELSLFAPVLRRTDPYLKVVAEYEEHSMVSTLSTQGQDCRPITNHCQSERRSMRHVLELGESRWDNG